MGCGLYGSLAPEVPRKREGYVSYVIPPPISSCCCIRVSSSPSYCTAPPASSTWSLLKTAKLTCITNTAAKTIGLANSQPYRAGQYRHYAHWNFNRTGHHTSTQHPLYPAAFRAEAQSAEVQKDSLWDKTDPLSYNCSK